MPASQRVANRIQEASRITVEIDSILCDACEDTCWVLEVWLHGAAGGQDYRTCALHRGHLSQAQAIRSLGSWSLGHARILTDREAEAWMLEHQQTLW